MIHLPVVITTVVVIATVRYGRSHVNAQIGAAMSDRTPARKPAGTPARARTAKAGATKPAPRQRRANGEESRRRILDAAVEIAGERGYEGTSIALVSARC